MTPLTPPSREAVPVGPDISPTEASEAVVAGRAVLLDVREADEWRAGRAPHAHHLPLGQLTSRSELITSGAADTVLTICRSGNRSALAAERLANAGVTARNVAGGMAAWTRAGLPVVRDGGAQGTVA